MINLEKLRGIVIRKVATQALKEEGVNTRVAEVLEKLYSIVLPKNTSCAEVLLAMEIATIEMLKIYVDKYQRGEYSVPEEVARLAKALSAMPAKVGETIN